jgi:hypothetical protein
MTGIANISRIGPSDIVDEAQIASSTAATLPNMSDNLKRFWNHQLKLGTVISEAAFGIFAGLVVGHWTDSWLLGIAAGVLIAALGVAWEEANRRSRRSQLDAIQREEDLRRRVTELEHELAAMKTEQAS